MKNEKGQIFENFYQYNRLCEKVPATALYYSRWNDKVTWQHPAEVHIDPITGETNEAYWKWRGKGMNNKYYIRHPIGFNYRHNVKYALWQNGKENMALLDKHEEWNINYQPKNESNKEPDSNKEPKKEPKKI